MAAAWHAARVLAIRDETTTAKTFRLGLDEPTGHRAGQHYVVRLTAPDGYTASRSYSVASAPDGSSEFELTVERFDDGEVSVFLHEVVEVGDELEVRGPIGGYFVWEGTDAALLIGGGSGVVPLMAMLRLARAMERTDLVHLLVSVRSPRDLYYADELPGPDTTILYTRQAAPESTRAAGRLTATDVEPYLRGRDTIFVCGSAPFTDAVGDLLLDLGVPAGRLRFERFGPSA